MNEADFRQLLAGASQSTRKLNGCAEAGDRRRSAKPEPSVSRLGEVAQHASLGEGYRLCFVEIEFWAAHAKPIDIGGNLAACDKNPLDALVNLGLAATDATIQTRVTQRMHRADLVLSEGSDRKQGTEIVIR